MKIGIYVGSFDPVHKGHLQVIKTLTEKYVDHILVIPTSSYWEKHLITSTKDRATMLELCRLPNTTITTQYSDFPYTYQILSSIEKAYPNDQLYLIIGSDNLKDLTKWKKIEKIVKHHIIVVARNKVNLLEELDKTLPKEKFILLSNFPYIEVSSTIIRSLIKENKLKALEDKLPSNVIKYLIDQHLYQST